MTRIELIPKGNTKRSELRWRNRIVIAFSTGQILLANYLQLSKCTVDSRSSKPLYRSDSFSLKQPFFPLPSRYYFYFFFKTKLESTSSRKPCLISSPSFITYSLGFIRNCTWSITGLFILCCY